MSVDLSSAVPWGFLRFLVFQKLAHLQQAL